MLMPKHHTEAFMKAFRGDNKGRLDSGIKQGIERGLDRLAIDLGLTRVHPTPAQPSTLGEDEAEKLVEDALQYVFDDFCGDTGCAPDCFKWTSKELTADFSIGNFAQNVAIRLLPHLPTDAKLKRLVADLQYQNEKLRDCLNMANRLLEKKVTASEALAAFNAAQPMGVDALQSSGKFFNLVNLYMHDNAIASDIRDHHIELVRKALTAAAPKEGEQQPKMDDGVERARISLNTIRHRAEYFSGGIGAEGFKTIIALCENALSAIANPKRQMEQLCPPDEGYYCKKHERGSRQEGAVCSECYRESIATPQPDARLREE